MSYTSMSIDTTGERFYDITANIKSELDKITSSSNNNSGILHIFTTHTSCALTIAEAFDHSAAVDMQNFLKFLAPSTLPFIEHTVEGDDDSPSHMKSIMLQQSISLIVDKNKLVLGQWQGIFLAEFRHSPKRRQVLIKFVAD